MIYTRGEQTKNNSFVEDRDAVIDNCGTVGKASASQKKGLNDVVASFPRVR